MGQAQTIARRIGQLTEADWSNVIPTIEAALQRGASPKAVENKLRQKVRETTGRIQRRRSRKHGVMVLVVDAEVAGYCTEAGRYATICEAHSTICNHETLQVALDWAPTCEWCEDCQGVSQ